MSYAVKVSEPLEIVGISRPDSVEKLSGSPANRTDENLAEALITSYMDGDRTKAIMPEGRREEVIQLLTGLMADPERFDAYITTITAERERLGRDGVLHYLGWVGLDIPDQKIAAEGFANLTNDELADFGSSPEALEAIREYLNDPETSSGRWLIDAILEVEAARPDAAENTRRAEEIYRRLKEEGKIS